MAISFNFFFNPPKRKEKSRTKWEKNTESGGNNKREYGSVSCNNEQNQTNKMYNIKVNDS